LRLSRSLVWIHRFLLTHSIVAGFLLAFSIIVGGLSWLLVHDWRAETTTEVSCERSSPLAARNSYIHIQLENQDPEEPSFEGNFFMTLGNLATSPMTVQMDTSQGRDYADNRDLLEFTYNQKMKVLLMKDRLPFDLIQTSGSHKLFPLDSAPFDFSLSFKPQVPFSSIMVENRVHGFVLDCRTLNVSRGPEGNIRIQFRLARDPLTQLTAVVLCIASFFFMLLILRLEKIESLATSVASFFFSLWSIRAILASEIRTFPTLLDLWILTLCTLMICGLTGKIIWTHLARSKKL
jgi:hypothetical protein